ncbi:MAG: catalase [Candidatus Competibacterales bacterium]
MVNLTQKLACIVLATLLPLGLSLAGEPTSADLVKALNNAFGRPHPDGMRAAHPKGICVAGQFSPAASAGEFSSTPALKAGTYPVIGRFSLAGGNPQASDLTTPRGLALDIALPEGGPFNLVMINSPKFPVATPTEFVQMLEKVAAQRQAASEAPEVDKPETPTIKPISSTSFTSAPYFAVHTFYFATADGNQPARWVFEPTAGRENMDVEAAQALDDANNYLIPELKERMAAGPSRWDIYLQLPEADDELNNATIAWPEERERIAVGHLVLDRVIEPGSADDCAKKMFNPLALPSGVTPADDPILKARPGAYGVSLSRRLMPVAQQ